MDPLQWMGAIITRVQTADINIMIIDKVIHTTPIHKWMSCEVKSRKSAIHTSLLIPDSEVVFFTGESNIMDRELIYYLEAMVWS